MVVGGGECLHCGARNGDNHNRCSGACSDDYYADEVDDDDIPSWNSRGERTAEAAVKTPRDQHIQGYGGHATTRTWFDQPIPGYGGHATTRT